MLTSLNTLLPLTVVENSYQGAPSNTTACVLTNADKFRHCRFTGSSGTVIVSRSEAHAFTDSRYFVQATRELDSNWTLHKVGLPGVLPWNEWIKDRPRGSRVGIDSRLISHGTPQKLSSATSPAKLLFYVSIFGRGCSCIVVVAQFEILETNVSPR